LPLRERWRKAARSVDSAEAVRLTRIEVADIIEAPALDAIREKCVDLHEADPHPGQYRGPAGLQVMRGTQVMRGLVAALRKE
jgi:hypothetical protein